MSVAESGRKMDEGIKRLWRHCRKRLRWRRETPTCTAIWAALQKSGHAAEAQEEFASAERLRGPQKK